MDPSSLVRTARDARARAHAPYSDFKVGAALVAKNGTIFVGVNVENASYGLTMCAERTAIGAAISQGHSAFTAIAVASDSGAGPCGACRQVLREFGPDLTVYIAGSEGPWRTTTISELLPDAFSGDSLGH